MLETAARFVTSWTGIGVLCGAIFLFAAVAYLRLQIKARPLLKGLRKLNSRLAEIADASDFVGKFEEFNESVSSDPMIGHLWREYAETLVMPRPDDRRQIIRDTEAAANFFNLATIVEARINLRFYREVSNSLPGMGILGTFIGLTAGILLARGGLMTNDTDLMRSALSQLLNGASLAFLTSILGLLLSIPYSYAEKRLDHHIQIAIDTWCNGLGQRLARITPEQIANDQLGELKDQTVQLQRFNTELSVSISSALEERLVQRFVPLMQQTLDVLEAIRANQQQADENLLHKLVDEFRKVFTGAAGSEMNAMASTLEQLTQKLDLAAASISGAGSQAGKELEEATRTAGVEIRKALEEMTNTLAGRQEKSEESFRSAAEGFSEQIRATANDLRQSGQQAGAGLADATARMTDEVSKASENMRSAAIQITSGVERTVGQFGDAVQRQVQAISEIEALARSVTEMLVQLRNNIKELHGVHASLERVSTPLGQVGAGLIATTEAQKKLIEQMEQLQSRTTEAAAAVGGSGEALKEAWENVHQRFAQIDQGLANAFAEINKGVEAHAEGVRNFVTELDQNFSKAASMLSGAIEELSAAIEELPTKQPPGSR